MGVYSSFSFAFKGHYRKFRFQNNINMKIALFIFAIALTMVASKPDVSIRGGVQKLPCGGIKENVESCTCEDGSVVTPGGQSCYDLKQKVVSCECKDASKR